MPGAPEERQGAGAVDAGRAVALALVDTHSEVADFARSPVVGSATVRFLLHEHEAGTIHLLGSWNGWAAPGAAARAIEPGLWEIEIPRPQEGLWQYKFLLDGKTWLPDPANPARAHDGPEASTAPRGSRRLEAPRFRPFGLFRELAPAPWRAFARHVTPAARFRMT